jgi:hypothetical protein
MGRCTHCSNKAAFMMSMCDDCIRAAEKRDRTGTTQPDTGHSPAPSVEEPASSYSMLGWIVFISGIVWLTWALNLDTTVSVGTTPFGGYGLPSEMHNIGLMNRKQNLVIASSLTILIGVAFIAIGAVRRPLAGGHPNPGQTQVAKDSPPVTRPCPFCAEPLRPQAILCRWCQRDVPAQGPTAASSPRADGGIETHAADRILGRG